MVRIAKSTRAGKKWMATFKDGTVTHFGDTNYDDYTQHGDVKRREAYRTRHRKDLDTGDYKRAGYLSYHILWGKHKNIKENILVYKRRYGLV